MFKTLTSNSNLGRLLVFALSIVMINAYNPVKARAQGQASEQARVFAQTLSANCLRSWTTQPCLKNISQSVLVLAANYAGDLESQGLIGAVEQIKQHCSAATAGTKGEYPAYAMQSAFTECANMIYDVSEQTKIKPDLSHYQLLVSSILCMNKDRSCSNIEKSLSSLR